MISTDIIAAMSWDDYSYANQSASELTATGAPTRQFAVPLLITASVLSFAFGIGVIESADRKNTKRITGILIVIFGIICFISLLFPMNMRGDEQSSTGNLHLIFTGVNIVLILLFIGFGSISDGRVFLIFSIGIILTILVFGALAGMQASRVDEGLPTPGLGIIERLSYYSPYLWMLVFASLLLHKHQRTLDH